MRTRTIAITAILILSAATAAAAIYARRGGMFSDTTAFSAPASERCLDAGGTWQENYEECEFVAEEWCLTSAGGGFDACASACRHNPDPLTPCTLQCVPVCSFRSAVSSFPGVALENASYVIGGNTVAFSDGKGMGPSGPIMIWAQAPIADVDGDGDGDVALVLASVSVPQTYYAAVALRENDGFVGTNAVEIGESVALQTVHVRDGSVLVNFSAPHPWEADDAIASVGRTKRLRYADGRLQEEQRESLSAESARVLAVNAWGDCASPDCGTLTVQAIDAKDGVWYVEAVYAGLADDSVAARRLRARAHDVEGTWAIGETLGDEQRCWSGRGHQEFSDEPCI